MDAEIGVRNLADTFRYNVLPDIINALDLARDKLGDGIESFKDLPEYEQLFMLVCRWLSPFSLTALHLTGYAFLMLIYSRELNQN